MENRGWVSMSSDSIETVVIPASAGKEPCGYDVGVINTSLTLIGVNGV